MGKNSKRGRERGWGERDGGEERERERGWGERAH